MFQGGEHLVKVNGIDVVLGVVCGYNEWEKFMTENSLRKITRNVT